MSFSLSLREAGLMEIEMTGAGNSMFSSTIAKVTTSPASRAETLLLMGVTARPLEVMVAGDRVRAAVAPGHYGTFLFSCSGERSRAAASARA